MDPLYDQPRSAPKPVTSTGFDSPVVPEVSLLFQNQVTQNNVNVKKYTNDHMSYNAWKIRNQVPNKENFMVLNKNNFSPQCGRKQVRFENHSNQIQYNGICSRIAQPTRQNEQMTLENEQMKFQNGQKKFQNEQMIFQKLQNEKIPSVNHMPSSTIISKPFEQIYIENIPNRHLDLSIIDTPTNGISNTKKNSIISRNPLLEHNSYNTVLPKPKNYEESKHVNHQDFLESHSRFMRNERDSMPRFSDNQTDNYYIHSERYDRHNFAYNRQSYDKARLINNDYRTSSNEAKTNKKDDEPTMKDLLKIIQQQNEQILLLQKQVAGLLEVDDRIKKIEPSKNTPYYELQSNQCDTIPVFSKNSDKNLRNPKFAIDVMTSFEVSIRPQQNIVRNKFIKDCWNEPKICEITEPNFENKPQDDQALTTSHTTEDTNKTDCSLVINEPIKVTEDTPSPDNSIHVDMQDYSSDSEEECVSSDLGWTIYNNIMGQVNNVLQRRQAWKGSQSNERGTASPTPADMIKEKTMQKVKETTLKHLKSIGVNINNIPTNCESPSGSSDNGNNEEFSPDEISFAVKQLLMKYLPNEELAKITYNQKKAPVKNQYLMKGNKRRPEFSFATLQYMKKYNLIENDPVVQKPPNRQKEDHASKFLDITALKQQPKLL